MTDRHDGGAREPFAARQQWSPAELATLRRLPMSLVRWGYLDAMLLFQPLSFRPGRLAEAIGDLLSPQAELVEVFGLAQSAPAEAIAGVLGDEDLETLCGMGVLHRLDRGLISLGGLMAVPVFGRLVLVGAPVVDPIVYYGDDSTALALRICPPTGGRCLDLCAGPGTQSIRACAAGGTAVAVELDPTAAAVAEVNALMNGLESRMEVRLGDLYEAVESGERFDFLSANPPLLPFPPEQPYPFVGHGGGDGLDVTRRILEGLPQVLEAEGTAQIIGTCLGGDQGPAPLDELDQMARRLGLQMVMTFPRSVSLGLGEPYFEGLALTCAGAVGIDAEQVRQRFASHLVALGADLIHTFFLTVSPSEAGAGLSAMTPPPPAVGPLWFRAGG